MTIIARYSTNSFIAGYLRYALDSVVVGVSKQYFVADLIVAELESLGISASDAENFVCYWYAEMEVDTLFENTSKLRGALSKYTLGYWDITIKGNACTGGYVQYLAQRYPVQKCWVSQDTFNYPGIQQPPTLGVVTGIESINTLAGTVNYGDCFHLLLDQVNPVGGVIQFYYYAQRVLDTGSTGYYLGEI